MADEYLIFCDESTSRGKYFSDFYGGVLVRSKDLQECVNAIAARKARENLLQEVKWDKVTANYLEKYKSLMDEFFRLVAADKLKVRVMFTHNVNVPSNLSAEQSDNQYFILYYHFIKHAFGLQHARVAGQYTYLRLLPDQLPDKAEQVAGFKGFLLGLNRSPQFREGRIVIREDGIAEIDSKDHPLLQCLDIVLGSMQFRLNDHHLIVPNGKRRRGKRTVAKEKLYRYINKLIRSIYPGFNIGVSTGIASDWSNRWKHSYRHWRFVPSECEYDLTKAKP